MLGLTACKTPVVEIKQSNTVNEIYYEMLPSLPFPPAFPKLEWFLEENERYSINAADSDALINYVENELSTYNYELEIYQKELDVVLNSAFKIADD